MSKITVEINRGGFKDLSLKAVEGAARHCAEELKISNARVSIVFVSDGKMRELNRKWRGRDKVTDVLSFEPSKDFKTPPDEPRDLGEVIIAYGEAWREAKKKGWPLGREIALLVIHGFLHCLGYDHETRAQEKKMFSLQDKILKEC